MVWNNSKNQRHSLSNHLVSIICRVVARYYISRFQKRLCLYIINSTLLTENIHRAKELPYLLTIQHWVGCINFLHLKEFLNYENESYFKATIDSAETTMKPLLLHLKSWSRHWNWPIVSFPVSGYDWLCHFYSHNEVQNETYFVFKCPLYKSFTISYLISYWIVSSPSIWCMKFILGHFTPFL